jgi:hypothetical protein
LSADSGAAAIVIIKMNYNKLLTISIKSMGFNKQ